MADTHECEVCKAPKGQPCHNTLARKSGGTITPNTPLPGRTEHLARVMPPGKAKGEK